MPYTHEAHQEHIRNCMAAGLSASRRVQVLKHGVTYCGLIKEAYSFPGGPDCWIVESDVPQKARFTVSCAKTIACGGLLCDCEADATRSHQAQAKRAGGCRG